MIRANPRSYELYGPLMVLTGGICIGFVPILLKFGLDDLGHQAIAFWRFIFAVPILLLFVILSQNRLPQRPNRFIIAAGVFFSTNIALWHWGLSLTTATNATFLVGLGNLGVGFTAWLVLRERPARLWFVAIIVAAVGAAALTFGVGQIGQNHIGGDALSLMAAIFVSFYVVFSKIARRQFSGLEAIFWLTCVEAVVSVIWVILSGESFLPETVQGFKVPLLLALVVQVAGQGLIITGLGRTPTAVAGVLIVIQPVVASVAAWVLLDEVLTLIQVWGCVFILFAIWLAQQSGVKPIK